MKAIPLTQGKVALVDDSDYEALSKFKWCAIRSRSNAYYAVRRDGKRRMFMQVFLIGTSPVDHRDGDGLNNQRNNLRPATQSQNCQNRRPRSHTSRFKAVWLRRDSGKWQSGIRVKGKLINLGCFSSEIEAAKAYDAAAVKHFGVFALTNLSLGLYTL